MTNISGKYKFNTKVGNVPEAVFLYKKLQDTTRPFEYQSESKSWQLHKAPVALSGTGRQQLVALELPDNTGDYDSEASAKLQKRKAEKKDVPCISNDMGDTEPGADRRSIIVLWVIRDTSLVPPEFVMAGNCAGYQGVTSGNPIGVTDADYIEDGVVQITKAPYIFFNQPYSFQDGESQGSKPYMNTGTAIFCQNPPSGIGGKVAYRMNVIWNNSAYRAANNSTGTSGVFYDSNKPSGWTGTGEEFLETCANNTYTAEIYAEWENVAGTTADLLGLNDCGSDALDGWWLYNALQTPGQRIGYRGNSISSLNQDYGYICWQGSQSAYGAWVSYMNSMLTFWGVLSNGAVLTRIGSMAINSQGGSCSTGDPSAGYPPDPNPTALPLIGRGQYHGRYCDIFVNYQKNGIVKELKLPIDFPTRITHVVYEHTGFYNPNLPMESPGQRTEANQFLNHGEWFSGRVNIDKENIYVDIIYEIIREYEDGLKVAPNGIIDGFLSGQHAIETPGIIQRSMAFGNTSEDEACYLSQPGEQIWARPTRDKFNKTVRYTINKSSFTIANTEVFTGSHSTTKNLFTDNFLKHNTILDISQRADYKHYHDKNNVVQPQITPPTGSDYDTPNVLNPSPSSIGYLGLPTPYFQINCKPSNNKLSAGTVFIESLYSPKLIDSFGGIADYTANITTDFLTSQTDWDDVFWVFYLMMERPFINRANPEKLIDFMDRCQRKGAGYNRLSNKFYLNYTRTLYGTGIYYDNARERVAPGFFDLYIEHERLRGYPIIKDGKIKQWLRLKPESFPLFQAHTGQELL
jgi:hypothetical protein